MVGKHKYKKDSWSKYCSIINYNKYVVTPQLLSQNLIMLDPYKNNKNILIIINKNLNSKQLLWF